MKPPKLSVAAVITNKEIEEEYSKMPKLEIKTSDPLPCPFCGESNIVMDDDGMACTNKKCYAEGPKRYNENEAIGAWNAAPRT